MKNLITLTIRPYLQLLPSLSFLTAVNSRRQRTSVRPRSHSPSCRLYNTIRGMHALTNPSASPFPVRSRLARLLLSFAFAVLIMNRGPLHAADVIWNNGTGTSRWNLTDLNWNTGVWNNANGDGAIFDATGAGPINVASPINVESLNLIASGYIFNGTGPLTFVDGTSTLATGIINVDTHFNVTINTPINSSLGLVKRGLGTLELAGPITFSGFGHPVTPGTNIIPVDIYAAGIPGQSPSDYSGITRIGNTSVLPTTTRVGVSNGLFDFGTLNLTLGSVTF